METPPEVQAQHDWFAARTRVGGQERELQALVGVLSHRRAQFCWVSAEATQLAWHTGHLALFKRYGGVPLWVRIDTLKKGESTDAVLRPTPLGRRARLQMAGIGAYGERWPLLDPDRVRRPREAYVQLVEEVLR
ncbi:MAG: hypothetical protein RQ751_12775 [Longimicrobiales bacterium]|nr:hypothetical protein [Longimicrobiales bacterium]